MPLREPRARCVLRDRCVCGVSKADDGSNASKNQNQISKMRQGVLVVQELDSLSVSCACVCSFMMCLFVISEELCRIANKNHTIQEKTILVLSDVFCRTRMCERIKTF